MATSGDQVDLGGARGRRGRGTGMAWTLLTQPSPIGNQSHSHQQVPRASLCVRGSSLHPARLATGDISRGGRLHQDRGVGRLGLVAARRERADGAHPGRRWGRFLPEADPCSAAATALLEQRCPRWGIRGRGMEETGWARPESMKGAVAARGGGDGGVRREPVRGRGVDAARRPPDFALTQSAESAARTPGPRTALPARAHRRATPRWPGRSLRRGAGPRASSGSDRRATRSRHPPAAEDLVDADRRGGCRRKDLAPDGCRHGNAAASIGSVGIRSRRQPRGRNEHVRIPAAEVKARARRAGSAPRGPTAVGTDRRGTRRPRRRSRVRGRGAKVGHEARAPWMISATRHGDAEGGRRRVARRFAGSPMRRI